MSGALEFVETFVAAGDDASVIADRIARAAVPASVAPRWRADVDGSVVVLVPRRPDLGVGPVTKSYGTQIELTFSGGPLDDVGTLEVELGGVRFPVSLAKGDDAVKVTTAVQKALLAKTAFRGLVSGLGSSKTSFSVWQDGDVAAVTGLPRPDPNSAPAATPLAVDLVATPCTAFDMSEVTGHDKKNSKIEFHIDLDDVEIDTGSTPKPDAEAVAFKKVAAKYVHVDLVHNAKSATGTKQTIIVLRRLPVARATEDLLDLGRGTDEAGRPYVDVPRPTGKPNVVVALRGTALGVYGLDLTGTVALLGELRHLSSCQGIALDATAAEIMFTPKSPEVTNSGKLPTGVSIKKEAALNISRVGIALPVKSGTVALIVDGVAVEVVIKKTTEPADLVTQIISAVNAAGVAVRSSVGPVSGKAHSVDIAQTHGTLSVSTRDTGLQATVALKPSSSNVTLFGTVEKSGTIEIVDSEVEQSFLVPVTVGEDLAAIATAVCKQVVSRYSQVERIRIVATDRVQAEMDLQPGSIRVSSVAEAGQLALRIGDEIAVVAVKSQTRDAVFAELAKALGGSPWAFDIHTDGDVLRYDLSAGLANDQVELRASMDLLSRTGEIAFIPTANLGEPLTVGVVVASRITLKASRAGVTRYWADVNGLVIPVVVSGRRSASEVALVFRAAFVREGWPATADGSVLRVPGLVKVTTSNASNPPFESSLEGKVVRVATANCVGAIDVPHAVATTIRRAIRGVLPSVPLGTIDATLTTNGVTPVVERGLSIDPAKGYKGTVKFRGGGGRGVSSREERRALCERSVTLTLEPQNEPSNESTLVVDISPDANSVDAAKEVVAAAAARPDLDATARLVGADVQFEGKLPDVKLTDRSSKLARVESPGSGREALVAIPVGNSFEFEVGSLLVEGPTLADAVRFLGERMPSIALEVGSEVAVPALRTERPIPAAIEYPIAELPKGIRSEARWSSEKAEATATFSTARVSIGAWSRAYEATIGLTSSLGDELLVTGAKHLYVEWDGFHKDSLLLRGDPRRGEDLTIALSGDASLEREVVIKEHSTLLDAAALISDAIEDLLTSRPLYAQPGVDVVSVTIEVFSPVAPTFVSVPGITFGDVTRNGHAKAFLVAVSGTVNLPTGVETRAIEITCDTAIASASVDNGDGAIDVARKIVDAVVEFQPPRLNWTVTAQDPAARRTLTSADEFLVDSMEHMVDTSRELFEYQPSHWVQFVNSVTAAGREPDFAVDLGTVETPIVVRSYPKPPELTNAVAEQHVPSTPIRAANNPSKDEDIGIGIEKALKWDYSATIRSPEFDAQDDLFILNIFNDTATDPNTLLDGASSGKAFYKALVGFAGAVGDIPDELSRAGQKGAPEVDASQVKVLLDAVSGVVKEWADWENGRETEGEAPTDPRSNPAALTEVYVLRFTGINDEKPVLRVLAPSTHRNGAGIRWPDITGFARRVYLDVPTQESRDVPPRTTVAPPHAPVTSAGSKWWVVEYEQTTAPLPVRKLHLTWRMLDLLTHETVHTRLQVRRNSELGIDPYSHLPRPVNPVLILKTDWVGPVHPIVPRLTVDGLRLTFDGDLYRSLHALLSPFGVMASRVEDVVLKIFLRFDQAVSVGSSGARVLRGRMPLTLENGVRLNGSGATRVPLERFVRELTSSTAYWFGKFQPQNAAPELAIDVTMFTERTKHPDGVAGAVGEAKKLPLLTLSNVTITDLPQNWAHEPLELLPMRPTSNLVPRAFPVDARDLAGLLLRATDGKKASLSTVTPVSAAPSAGTRTTLVRFSLGERRVPGVGGVSVTNTGRVELTVVKSTDKTKAVAVALEIPGSQVRAEFLFADAVDGDGSTNATRSPAAAPSAWDTRTVYFLRIVETAGPSWTADFSFGTTDHLGDRTLYFETRDLSADIGEAQAELSLDVGETGPPPVIILRGLTVESGS